MSTCVILKGDLPVEVPSGLTIIAGVYCTEVRNVNLFRFKGGFVSRSAKRFDYNSRGLLYRSTRCQPVSF